MCLTNIIQTMTIIIMEIPKLKSQTEPVGDPPLTLRASTQEREERG
ncbi:hypothetical protein LINGRAHAP2_LOCUS10335 [Linum grandiflorum]